MRVIRMMLLALLLTAGTAGQQALGTLQGTVVEMSTGRPVANAEVTIRSVDGTFRVTTTADQEGRFAFTRLSPATYRAAAIGAGYVSKSASVASVSSGESKSIELDLVPGARISGRVTDRGQPAGAANVSVLKTSYDAGRLVLSEVLTMYTDDRGEYRVFWLPPGRYYVRAEAAAFPNQVFVNSDPSSPALPVFPGSNLAGGGVTGLRVLKHPLRGAGEDMAYAPIFPGRKLDWREASYTDLSAGADARVDIDVSPIRPWHVRGKLDFGTGSVTAFAVNLVEATGGAIASQNLNNPNGTFDLLVFAPGSYFLTATTTTRTGGRGAPVQSDTLSLRVPIEVRDQDLNLALSMDRGSVPISGAVTVEKTAKISSIPSDSSPLAVTLRPDPWLPGSPSYTVPAIRALEETPTDLRANFALPGAGLPPGNYRVIVAPLMSFPFSTMPTGAAFQKFVTQKAYVKSIRFGEQDVLAKGLRLQDQVNAPLEIVIGLDPGTLAGRVTNAEHRPVADATVALLPESILRFQVAHLFTVTGTDGQFKIEGIPPGNYKVFAWDNVESGAWQNREFISDYESRGVALQIRAGDARNLEEIAVIPVSR